MKLFRKRGILWLLAFWVAQTALVVLMKIGTMRPEWYQACQIICITSSILTTWLLMRVFDHFQAHLAQALGIGLSFLLCQVALAAIVRNWLSVGQWAGILAIMGGIFLLSEKTALMKE